METSIKNIFLAIAVLALIALGTMFIIPVIGAVLLFFFGMFCLLVFTKWFAGLFNGGVDPNVNGVEEVSVWESDGHNLKKIAHASQDIEDGEIVEEETDK